VLEMPPAAVTSGRRATDDRTVHVGCDIEAALAR
jgi:hypothetical protein